MSDLTEAIYSPHDVVWVKLGPIWWPGRVCDEDEIPPEIMKDLRKKPIAIVKFFQEDSFEYVKSLSNIYHYHCPRKNEFIKKGLDMLRSKNRGAPSNMKLFPEDIVRAESLTHGNPAILQNDMFLPEEKPAYTDLFTSNKKPPKKLKPELKKKQTPVKPNTPRLITHPRFLQLSSGQNTDYEVRERMQIPVRAECDEEDTSPPALYSCTECEYTTTRLNVMVWHNKSHTRNYASPQMSGKATKRKSTASVKLKERPSGGSPSVEPKANDVEEASAAKIPKTNGALKESRSPKTPGRKKGTTPAKKTPTQSTPHTKEPNSTSPAEKGRRGSAQKGDEIHQSLLEDWLEDDMELEESATDQSSVVEEATGENKASLMTSGDSKSKSCFDFDDSEDHLVIDKSKFKPGRKIPRLVTKSTPSTITADDVVAIQDSVDAMNVDTTIADSVPKYQSGVEDSMDGESSLNSCQTSQLQVMGVDNEIEIKTEEIHFNEVVVDSVPPEKSLLDPKTEAKANDAAELHDQVDKLLNEIDKAPVKLPVIPRSHKKAQLKAYQQQAEAEKQAAQKAANEAEAARIATAESEAALEVSTETAEMAHNTAAETEVVQQSVTEVEVTQGATAEAEASQTLAIQNEDTQIAVAEVETTPIVTARTEIAQEVVEQNALVESESALEAPTGVPNVNEQSISVLHPETIDLEVSNIPLPSSPMCPVTSEPVESSISIGACVTVADDETLDEQSSIISPEKNSIEMLVTENMVTEEGRANSVAVEQKTAPAALFSHLPQIPASAAVVTEAGGLSAVVDAKTQEKSTTTFKTAKPPNVAPLLRISPSRYKLLMNQASHASSPNKTSAEPLKTMKTTLKTACGKSILCDLSPSKMLLNNSKSTSSPTKFLIVGKATAASTTTVSTPVGRSISLANATTLRISPSVLPKTAAAQKAAAALAKSTGKNIVLDAKTFQSLFHTQPQQLRKLQSQILLPEVTATAEPKAPSGSSSVAMAAPSQSKILYMTEAVAPVSNLNGNSANAIISSSNSSVGQTVDYNYIVDSSGNLVLVDEQSNAPTPTKDKDILAKALENTYGLQSEMVLSEVVTNSVLDTRSIVQNTEMASKTDTIYENLTLNTPPIMSAFETPSRVVAAVNLPTEVIDITKGDGNCLT